MLSLIEILMTRVAQKMAIKKTESKKTNNIDYFIPKDFVNTEFRSKDRLSSPVNSYHVNKKGADKEAQWKKFPAR